MTEIPRRGAANRRRKGKATTATGPMTPATAPANPTDKPIGPPGQNEEQRLDEALEETFPASDPVSTRIE